jgi:hypothetical protein
VISNSIRAPPLSAADSTTKNDVPLGIVSVSPVTAITSARQRA